MNKHILLTLLTLLTTSFINAFAADGDKCLFGGAISFERNGVCSKPWENAGLENLGKDETCNGNSFRCPNYLFGVPNKSSHNYNGVASVQTSQPGKGYCIKTEGFSDITQLCDKASKGASTDALADKYKEEPEVASDLGAIVSEFCDNPPYAEGSECSILLSRANFFQGKPSPALSEEIIHPKEKLSSETLEALSNCHSEIDKKFRFKGQDKKEGVRNKVKDFFFGQRQIRDRRTVQILGGDQCVPIFDTLDNEKSLADIKQLAKTFDGVNLLSDVVLKDFEQKTRSLLFNQALILGDRNKTVGRRNKANKNYIPYRDKVATRAYFEKLFPALKNSDSEYREKFDEIYDEIIGSLELRKKNNPDFDPIAKITSAFSDGADVKGSAASVNNTCSQIRKRYEQKYSDRIKKANTQFEQTQSDLEKKKAVAIRKAKERHQSQRENIVEDGGKTLSEQERRLDRQLRSKLGAIERDFKVNTTSNEKRLDRKLYDFKTREEDTEFLANQDQEVTHQYKTFNETSGVNLIKSTPTFKNKILNNRKYKSKLGESCVRGIDVFKTGLSESDIQDGFEKVKSGHVSSLKALNKRQKSIDHPNLEHKPFWKKALELNPILARSSIGAAALGKKIGFNSNDKKNLAWEKNFRDTLKQQPYLISQVLEAEDKKGNGADTANYLCGVIDEIYSSDEFLEKFEFGTWGVIAVSSVSCPFTGGAGCLVAAALGGLETGISGSKAVESFKSHGYISQAYNQGTIDLDKYEEEYAIASKNLIQDSIQTGLTAGFALVSVFVAPAAVAKVKISLIAKAAARQEAKFVQENVASRTASRTIASLATDAIEQSSVKAYRTSLDAFGARGAKVFSDEITEETITKGINSIARDYALRLTRHLPSGERELAFKRTLEIATKRLRESADSGKLLDGDTIIDQAVGLREYLVKNSLFGRELSSTSIKRIKGNGGLEVIEDSLDDLILTAQKSLWKNGKPDDKVIKELSSEFAETLVDLGRSPEMARRVQENLEKMLKDKIQSGLWRDPDTIFRDNIANTLHKIGDDVIEESLAVSSNLMKKAEYHSRQLGDSLWAEIAQNIPRTKDSARALKVAKEQLEIAAVELRKEHLGENAFNQAKSQLSKAVKDQSLIKEQISQVETSINYLRSLPIGNLSKSQVRNLKNLQKESVQLTDLYKKHTEEVANLSDYARTKREIFIQKTKGLTTETGKRSFSQAFLTLVKGKLIAGFDRRSEKISKNIL